MKIIRIKDCSECPNNVQELSTYTNYCDASIRHRIDTYPTIPDWCELEEVEGGKEKK